MINEFWMNDRQWAVVKPLIPMDRRGKSRSATARRKMWIACIRRRWVAHRTWRVFSFGPMLSMLRMSRCRMWQLAFAVSPEFGGRNAGGKVSKTMLTQVGRTLSQIGIEHIAAYSPQARGRSERMFLTLQDRPRSSGWPGSPRSRRPTGG
jgi:hypothetical protein